MSDTALYYALSTIAQCAAALAALIGFLGLWRLDRLRDEDNQVVQRLKNLMIPFIKAARRPDLDRHAILQLARENISAPKPWPEDTDLAHLQRDAKLQLEAGLTRIQELANTQRWLLWALQGQPSSQHPGSSSFLVITGEWLS
jgi:hypothetical protein